jgi:DNA-binding CsgD family transcriptional regulator
VTGIDDVRETTIGQALSERLVALLAGRPGPSPFAVAEVVRSICAVDHVALVEIGPDECTVLAAAGPELLTVGTSSPAAVSTRLVAVSEGRVWSSPDVSRELGFARPIDQLHLALGIRACAGVPLPVRGGPAAAVLLSCMAPGRDWSPVLSGIAESAGLLVAALGSGRGKGEPLRVAVIHPDLLVAHGLARIVERGLPAEVEVAAGTWDPRLDEIVARADVVVADSAVGWTGNIGGLVIVHDGSGPAAPGGNIVPRDAAPGSLVAAVARASSVAGPERPVSFASGLSAREFELLRELASGKPYKEIANGLRLSTATVRGYSRGLYAKIGVHSRAEAVAKASRAGLIEF